MGSLKAELNQNVEELGLSQGKYSLRVGNDGKSVHMRLLNSAEPVFALSRSLTSETLKAVKVNPGQYPDQYPELISFLLPGDARSQRFNMDVKIFKKSLKMREVRVEEDCTKAVLCDREERKDCDGTLEVTYRIETVRYALRATLTRAGVEADSTVVARFEGATGDLVNTYEIDRDMFCR